MFAMKLGKDNNVPFNSIAIGAIDYVSTGFFPNLSHVTVPPLGLATNFTVPDSQASTVYTLVQTGFTSGRVHASYKLGGWAPTGTSFTLPGLSTASEIVGVALTPSSSNLFYTYAVQNNAPIESIKRLVSDSFSGGISTVTDLPADLGYRVTDIADDRFNAVHMGSNKLLVTYRYDFVGSGPYYAGPMSQAAAGVIALTGQVINNWDSIKFVIDMESAFTDVDLSAIVGVNYLRSVAISPVAAVAVGLNNIIIMSDLVTVPSGEHEGAYNLELWSVVDNVATAGVNWTNIIWDGANFYAFAKGTPKVIKSADGITWTAVAVPQVTSIDVDVFDLYSDGANQFLVCMSSGNVPPTGQYRGYYSNDGGVTWIVKSNFLTTTGFTHLNIAHDSGVWYHAVNNSTNLQRRSLTDANMTSNAAWTLNDTSTTATAARYAGSAAFYVETADGAVWRRANSGSNICTPASVANGYFGSGLAGTNVMLRPSNFMGYYVKETNIWKTFSTPNAATCWGILTEEGGFSSECHSTYNDYPMNYYSNPYLIQGASLRTHLVYDGTYGYMFTGGYAFRLDLAGNLESGKPVCMYIGGAETFVADVTGAFYVDGKIYIRVGTSIMHFDTSAIEFVGNALIGHVITDTGVETSDETVWRRNFTLYA